MFQFIRNNCNNNIHDESIYNLVANCDRERCRPPRYVSRFACKVRQEAYCSKQGCFKTMGIPKTYLDSPKCFLRKFSRTYPCFWKKPLDLKSKSCCGNLNQNVNIEFNKCPCELCACRRSEYNQTQHFLPGIKSSQSETRYQHHQLNPNCKAMTLSKPLTPISKCRSSRSAEIGICSSGRKNNLPHTSTCCKTRNRNRNQNLNCHKENTEIHCSSNKREFEGTIENLKCCDNHLHHHHEGNNPNCNKLSGRIEHLKSLNKNSVISHSTKNDSSRSFKPCEEYCGENCNCDIENRNHEENDEDDISIRSKHLDKFFHSTNSSNHNNSNSNETSRSQMSSCFKNNCEQNSCNNPFDDDDDDDNDNNVMIEKCHNAEIQKETNNESNNLLCSKCNCHCHVSCSNEDYEEEEVVDCCNNNNFEDDNNKYYNEDRDEIPGRIPAAWSGGFNYIERGRKDFIRDNALAVIRSPPKIPSKWIVDDIKGHRSEWKGRNLLKSKYFGRIPCYLEIRKQQLYNESLEMKCRIERENMCRPLSDETRRMIVHGLQLHWDEVFNEYQHLPLFSSSPRILKLKGALERQLREIEKDLQLFKRNGPLYIDRSRNAKSHYL